MTPTPTTTPAMIGVFGLVIKRSSPTGINIIYARLLFTSWSLVGYHFTPKKDNSTIRTTDVATIDSTPS